MRQMLLLLIGAFILVNVVTGYLNADRSIAGPASVKLDLSHAHDIWRPMRAVPSQVLDERKN